jgi:LysM repeat protein
MEPRMTNRIDQPREFDLVGNPILIAGVGTGFEATLQYRVHEGHDEVAGHFMAGGGTGEHGQFQLQVDVSGASFTLDRLFVEIFELSAKDGSEINKVTVPVILGTRIVDGYFGYREHTVKKGDTLWAIAQANYGKGSLFPRIVRANPNQISDPDKISPGQVLKIPIGSS